MTIQFQCECGQKYAVKDRFAGRKAGCKVCGEILQIPGAVSRVRAKPKPAPLRVEEDVWEGMDYEEEELELPVRRKKRKSSDLPSSKKSKNKKRNRNEDEGENTSDDDSGGISTGVIVAMLIGAAVVVVGGLGFLVMSIQGRAGGLAGVQAVAEVADPADAGDGAEAPAQLKMQEVRNDLGGFAIDFPDGWEIRTGGGSGGVPPFASARKGSILLSVKADPHGTALFTNNANMITGELRMEDHPVHAAHGLVKVKIENEYDSYEETDPEQIKSAYGEGRLSSFTAKEGFFSTSKGLRATYLSNSWCLKVICKCPSGEFAENEAMFRSVIESFKN